MLALSQSDAVVWAADIVDLFGTVSLIRFGPVLVRLCLLSDGRGSQLFFREIPAFGLPNTTEQLVALGLPLVEINPVGEVVTFPFCHTLVEIERGLQKVIAPELPGLAERVLLLDLAKVVNQAWQSFARVTDRHDESGVRVVLSQKFDVTAVDMRTADISLVFARSCAIVNNSSNASFDKIIPPVLKAVQHLPKGLIVVRAWELKDHRSVVGPSLEKPLFEGLTVGHLVV